MTRSFAAFLVLAAATAVAGCQPRASSAPEAHPSGSNSAAKLGTPDAGAPRVGTRPGNAGAGTPLVPAPGHELAAFAEGCFWGSENTFRHVPGVVATAVGFTGGHTKNPTYEEVSSHTTGHAETVLVEYDPKRVSYADLLLTFWDTHDPTTKNRQGPDVGDQYRSAIFTFSDSQDQVARAARVEEQKRRTRPITTEISRIGAFYVAEEYHQQYDEKTGSESCPLPQRHSETRG